jgi:hypothetical protein
MKADFKERIEQMLEEAYRLSDGPAKLALLEDAVRLADKNQHLELGDSLRSDLIRTATFAGYPDKALAAFSWRLAQADHDPRRFPESELLWEYKWITESLPGSPQVTRPQIEDMLEDMATRYQRSSASLRAIHKLRCQIAMAMHERAEASKHYRKWEKTPRDWNTDCAACEQHHRVRFQLFQGKTEDAVEEAEPILRGSLRCAEVPHSTYATVLMPLLQLERLPEAMKYHQKGYRLIAENRKFLDEVAEHITFLTLTDNLAQAVKLFEQHLQWALDTKDLHGRWKFYLAAHFLFGRLVETGQTDLILRLPLSFPLYKEECSYDAEELAAWVEEECRSLAEQFDARNGNEGFAKRLAGNARLKKWVSPFRMRGGRKE